MYNKIVIIIIFGEIMRNYSKQREAIELVLKATKSHPGAVAVYNEVKKIIPNISLGTVYRNLAEMQNDGTIRNISVCDGTDRFDADITPHIHLHCRVCGSITDLHLKKDYGQEFATEKGFSPESSVYVIHGVCEKCSRK